MSEFVLAFLSQLKHNAGQSKTWLEMFKCKIFTLTLWKCLTQISKRFLLN